jgi:hypothetical protein
MRLFGLEIGWRGNRYQPAAPFRNALLRVRSLRERCQWAPLSNQAAIRRREDRLRAIRKSVRFVYNRTCSFIDDHPEQSSGGSWFGLAGPLPWPLLVVLLVFWVLMYRIVSTWPE